MAISFTIGNARELFGALPLFELLMLAVIWSEIEMVRKMEMVKEMEMTRDVESEDGDTVL